jgi:integrase/recombinase XerD
MMTSSAAMGAATFLRRFVKGMYLLESGTSLDMIRDFLGHMDVKTPQIYARAHLEMK